MGDRDEAEANAGWKCQDIARLSDAAPICPNNNPSTLLALPLDLLEQILLRLDAQGIRTCTLLSKEFNALIRSSIVLQYLIACHAAGVVDNPRCTLSYDERHEALLKREKAWRRFQPVFTKTFDVPNKPPKPPFGIHKLTAGYYLLSDNNRRDLHYCALPSTPDEVPQWATIHGHGPKKDWSGAIVGVGMAVYEHDLVVNVVSLIDTQDNRVVHSLNMVPLQFSTGKYHPLAHCPQIYVQDFDETNPDIALEIVGDNVALATQASLFIFDWKTGRKKLQYKALNNASASLVFISPETLLVPNDTQAHLEVWKIPKEVDQVPYQLRLRLPRPSAGHFIFGTTVRSAPNPYIHDMSYAPPRPFYTSADSAIIVVSLRVMPFNSVFAIFIHRRSLLDLTTKFSHVNVPSAQAPTSETPRGDVVSIPWSEWGPPISRWLDIDETPLTWSVAPGAGPRWAFIDLSFGLCNITIYDFNRHNMYHPQEGLPGRLVIVGKGHTFGRDGDFADDIKMGLGCTVYVLPEKYDFNGVSMDEERMLGYKLNREGHIAKITVFHFG